MEFKCNNEPDSKKFTVTMSEDEAVNLLCAMMAKFKSPRTKEIMEVARATPPHIFAQAVDKFLEQDPRAHEAEMSAALFTLLLLKELKVNKAFAQDQAEAKPTEKSFWAGFTRK